MLMDAHCYLDFSEFNCDRSPAIEGEAKKYFEKTLEIDPNNKKAQYNLDYPHNLESK